MVHANRRIPSTFWIFGLGCFLHLVLHRFAYFLNDSPNSLHRTGYLPGIHSSRESRDSGSSLQSNASINHMATLRCEQTYGGPLDEYAQEMVYWHDIPSDSLYLSPLRRKTMQQSSSFRQGKYIVRSLVRCVFLASTMAVHWFLLKYRMTATLFLHCIGCGSQTECSSTMA
jgi:hypothetical protein